MSAMARVLLSVVLSLLALLPAASAAGVVNGYCNGYSKNLTCSLDNLRSHSSYINSLAVSSYHLSKAGLVIPCADGDYNCPFPGDVEAYNARVVREVPGVLVVPLVFDNDGLTVEQTRAMWAGGHAAENIQRLVNATLRYNYSGLSMDWEPSCWEDQPSDCSWPTVEEANAYTQFLSNLSDAFVANDRVLTVCADHEMCLPDVDCGGDDYIKHCLANEYSMSWCNCCAFQTWLARNTLESHTHTAYDCSLPTRPLTPSLDLNRMLRFNATALCAIPTRPNIAVMDSYGDAHPFNASDMTAAVQPWFDAGCTAERMSFGLLSDQALSPTEATAVLDAVSALGVKRVDIWSQPWTWPNFTEVWSDGFKRFIADNETAAAAVGGGVEAQHRHAGEKRMKRKGGRW